MNDPRIHAAVRTTPARYRIELAGAADDRPLRGLLAATPMPGAIAVTFQREPSYFDAGVVEGPLRQVMVAREEPTGTIVGCGTRSILERYMNGQPRPVGYLSNLRILPDHRRGALLARGYRFLRELHADGRACLYLTTVARDNLVARQLLTSGRAGLPCYHPAGRFHTVILPLERARRRGAASSNQHGVSIRPATLEDKAAVLAFLNRSGPSRQFFPCYAMSDLWTAGGLLHGLAPRDLLLAFRGSELVGTLGGWDQTPFRQNVIDGYAASLRWLRPGYNLWARLRGLPQLPAAGQTLRSRVAALPLTAAGNEAAFGLLLEAMLERLHGTEADHLLVGLHETDPLLPVLQRYRARWYTTAVYYVYWPDGQAMCEALDERPVYLELGAL